MRPKLQQTCFTMKVVLHVLVKGNEERDKVVELYENVAYFVYNMKPTNIKRKNCVITFIVHYLDTCIKKIIT